MLRQHASKLALLLLPLLMGFSHLVPQRPLSSEPEAAVSPLRGAWMMVEKDNLSSEDLAIQMVKILSNGHFMFAFFNSETQQFFSAGGGTYAYEDGKYTEKIEFHTIDPSLAGREITFDCHLEGDRWHQTGEINGGVLNEVYKRIDDGTGTDLIGTWKQEYNVSPNGKRSHLKKHHNKLKILSGTRFQWVEYNGKKNEFVACGGGTYSYAQQTYTENLEFFSADSTVVGKDITFTCLQDGNEWVHREKLARGSDEALGVDEIWSRSDW